MIDEFLESKMEKTRKEQYECAKKIMQSLINEGHKGVFNYAPCKSGKADIKTCIAELCTLYKVDEKPLFSKPILMGSFYQKDMKEQIERHESNGMCVIKTHRVGDSHSANLAKIREHLDSGDKEMIPLVLIDEADYGSAKDQKLESLVDSIFKEWKEARVVFFSATLEECVNMLNKDDRNTWDVQVFEPSEKFKQMQDYVNAGLVETVEPFWTEKNKGKLSSQGKSAISKLTHNRPIGIIRYQRELTAEQIEELKKLNVEVHYINSNNKQKQDDFWQKPDYKFHYNHTYLNQNEEPPKFRLYVIKNMLSRSVELKWIEHVAFAHDRTTVKRDLATSVQRIGRFNTYKEIGTTLYISDQVRNYVISTQEICHLSGKEFLSEWTNNMEKFTRESDSRISLRTNVIRHTDVELSVLEIDEYDSLHDAYMDMGVEEFNGKPLESMSEEDLDKYTYQTHPAEWKIKGRKDLVSVISDVKKLLGGSAKYSIKTHIGTLIDWPKDEEWDQMAVEAFEAEESASKEVALFLRDYKDKYPYYNGKKLLVRQKSQTKTATVVENEKSIYNSELARNSN